MNIPKTVQADMSLVLATVIWGSTFAIVRKALAQVSPLLFISMRFWVASVVILVFLPRAVRDIRLETLRRGSILSVFLLGGFVFQTLGLRTTTPSRSAFITSLSVLLVPLFGFLIFRHLPRLQTLAGVSLASVGLGFLTLDRLEFSLNSGDFLTLICAAVFALHILFVGRYTPHSDFRQLVTLQMIVAALLSTLMMPALETPFLVWDMQFGAYLLVTGVLATALCFYIQNRAQQFTTANRTALIFSLEPVFAAIFAYVLIGESLTVKEWIGGGLVTTGILFSELRRT